MDLEAQIQQALSGNRGLPALSNSSHASTPQDLEAQIQQALSGGQESPSQPSSPATGSWGGFEQTASQIAQNRNFPTNVLLGQAALESGHGTSNYAQNRNNYFGYQAYDSNPDAAKRYASPEQSINDYIDLIENTPRYQGAYQQFLQDHDARSFIQNIWKSGYATDPNYVAKVEAQPEFNN